MISNYEKILELSKQISVAEKINLLEHLSSTLKEDLEIEAYKHIPWEQFIDLTYGSLADDPIERNQPPHPEERDEIV